MPTAGATALPAPAPLRTAHAQAQPTGAPPFHEQEPPPPAPPIASQPRAALQPPDAEEAPTTVGPAASVPKPAPYGSLEEPSSVFSASSSGAFTSGEFASAALLREALDAAPRGGYINDLSTRQPPQSGFIPSQAWTEALRYYPGRLEAAANGDSPLCFSGKTHTVRRVPSEELEFDVRSRLGLALRTKLL